MDIDDLVDMILSFPDSRRATQAETPDFRVGTKIFATLPSSRHLVLKLTTDQQDMVMRADPDVFSPVDGAWGDRGWTNANISAIDEASALSVLSIAWANAADDKDHAGSHEVHQPDL